MSLILCAVVFAAPAWGATTQPSATQATVPLEQVRAWLQRLGDRDSRVRTQAVEDLMGLKRSDLPALQKVVAETRPLLPGQTALLRDIVQHVYISGAEYPVEGKDAPFLGLSWSQDESSATWPELNGVPVRRRVPGFSAYQILRDGDVLQGIEELPNVMFRETGDVGAAVASFRPGQTITLKIERQGQAMSVRVTLRPKPQLPPIELGTLDTWLDQQTAAADQYWDETFAPLLGGGRVM